LLTENSERRLLWVSMHLTIACIVAGGLGYVFQILMGRLLADAEFAVFSALNSLSMVFGSPLAALMMLIGRRVASLQATGEDRLLPAMYLFWQTRVAAGSLVAAGLSAGAMQAVQGFVKTGDLAVIWLFWGVVAMNALVFINGAFFQGLQRFGWLSCLTLLIVIVKIAVSASLIAVGDWGVRGALVGMLCAAGMTWAFGWRCLQRDFCKSKPDGPRHSHGFRWAEAAPVLCGTVGFAVLSQIDVPLANRFFEPSVASDYAAAAVLGKAVLYIPGGLALALFPMVAAGESRSESTGFLLRQSLLTTLGICTAIAVGYAVCGNGIINVLYGDRYYDAGNILQWYGFAMIPLAAVGIIKHYSIARGRAIYPSLLCLVALAFAYSVWGVRPTLPEDLIMRVAVSGLIMFLVGIGGSVVWKRFLPRGGE
jgi:O-antigen/teichoic acid export membrane protein